MARRTPQQLLASRSRGGDDLALLAAIVVVALVTIWRLGAPGTAVVLAAPAIDASSTASGVDATSLTFSHTVGSGGDRLLLVGVATTGSASVTGITYGGTALTSIGSIANGNKARAHMWRLVAPASGTADLVVTLSAQASVIAGAVSFTGVDPTTPTGTFFSASAKSTAPSVTVTGTLAGEIVVDVLAVKGSPTATAGAGQTERWNVAFSSDVRSAASTEDAPAGGGDVAMSWALGSNIEWALGAVALKAVTDTTPPVNAATYPKAGTISTSSIEVLVEMDETGTAYFVALPDGATAPSAAQVKAGQDATGAAVASGRAGSIALSANTEGSGSASGLSASTAYDVYVVAEDAAANLQASAVKVDATTSAAPDTTPPVNAATYPKAGTVTSSSVELLAQVDEAGTAYFVALDDGATAPSAAQVKAGQDATGAAVAAGRSGSIALTANTEGSGSVTGLSASTAYDIYVVAEDGVPNLQTSAVKVDATTSAAPDATPPVNAATYPKAGTVTSSSVELLAQVDEAGTAYFVALDDGATAPSAAQVKAGQDATGAAVASRRAGSIALSANTEGNSSTTGLNASTAYDLYIVAEDSFGNLQSSPAKVDATTSAAPDITPPVNAAGYPNVGVVSAGSVQVLAKVDEAGTAYFVALPDGAAAPNAAQVKAGQDATGAAVASGRAGSIALSANIEGSGSASGLSASTAYDLYVVAEDAVPNLQASAVKVDATTSTAPHTAPPVNAAGYPNVGVVSAGSVQVLAKMDEAGTAYFVALADGATAPSVAQVKAGQDSTGTAVAASRRGSIALSANTEGSRSATGLAASTAYDLYVVAEDSFGNLQASAVKVEATTSASPETTPVPSPGLEPVAPVAASLPMVRFRTAFSADVESVTPATMVVALSETSERTVTVAYRVTGGSATGGIDYAHPEGAGILTFAPGQTLAAIAIDIVDDDAFEALEMIDVTLFTPRNAVLGEITRHTYGIVDDDRPLPPGAPAPPVTPPSGELRGDVPAAGQWSLLLWSGGTVQEMQLAARTGGCEPMSVWVSRDGRLVGYIFDAPERVNEAFLKTPPGGSLAANTPVILACRDVRRAP